MADKNDFNYSASLISGQNYVQSPFIIVKIGEYTFGTCTKQKNGQLLNVTYPNYLDGLTITKVNGAVNVYQLEMTYAISNTDDPNLLDKVFSSVSESREITLSYGDWELPNYIFKEEKAIITKIVTRVNMGSSTINYSISCTSTSLALQSGVYNFPAYSGKKPSEIIKTLLNRKAYGLTELFKGMADKDLVLAKGFIASDDKAVDIPAKNSTNILDYIGFLVSYMVSTDDTSVGDIRNSVYLWYVCDDVNREFGGNYFKVVKVNAKTTNLKLYNAYEIDIGFPSANNVVNFTINQDDSWSILYDYSKSIQLPQYTYSINNKGEIEENYSPVVTNSGKYFITTEADRTWWTQMTQFPIQATLTIQGILRPATLMTYVKLNVYFYSKKHVSSGLYIITKQQDTIGSDGYKTTLSLTRIQGDENYEV